jgi:hypothetical protein
MEAKKSLVKCRDKLIQKSTEKKIKSAQKKVCTFSRKSGQIDWKKSLYFCREKNQQKVPKYFFKSAQKKCALFFI